MGKSLSKEELYRLEVEARRLQREVDNAAVTKEAKWKQLMDLRQQLQVAVDRGAGDEVERDLARKVTETEAEYNQLYQQYRIACARRSKAEQLKQTGHEYNSSLETKAAVEKLEKYMNDKGSDYNKARTAAVHVLDVAVDNAVEDLEDEDDRNGTTAAAAPFQKDTDTGVELLQKLRAQKAAREADQAAQKLDLQLLTALPPLPSLATVAVPATLPIASAAAASAAAAAVEERPPQKDNNNNDSERDRVVFRPKRR